jgi:hypothetical protein
MNDSLTNIIDSLKILSSNQIKDTVYIVVNNSSKNIVDILPIIIAALALILSSVAVYISKKALDTNIVHQKLSVIPALTYFEDFTLRPNCEGIGLVIINSGLGPALVKHFKILWGTTQINNQEEYSKIPKDLFYGAFEGSFYTKGSVIDKSKEKWLFRIPLNYLYLSNGAIDMDKVDKVRIALKNNLKVEIVYRSFYDEEEYEYIFKYPVG